MGKNTSSDNIYSLLYLPDILMAKQAQQIEK